MESETMGQVYLVGAGPGDVAYLTVEAQQRVAQADVLIYDALVDEQLLQLTPASCEQIQVGKRGGKPSWEQADINRLLVNKCREGKRVVRLKSGDPFIFGRCTAEIEALKAQNCPFDVIPGISSALAAPLLAGIPLTDPVLSRYFTVLSGHQPDELDWENLTPMPTLVILMGTRKLPEILWQLQRHGKSAQTPIAILRACGSDRQQVWTGTLADILDRTRGETLSPAIIAIGDVVRLRHYLQVPHLQKQRTLADNANRFVPSVISDSMPETSVSNLQSPNENSQLPLSGQTILVTRSSGQSSTFTTMLENAGATAIEMPALEIGPPSSWEPLDRAIAALEEFDWLVLTSANGVRYFCDRLLANGKDTRALAGIKIAVVGKKTAATLKTYCIKPDFIPPNFVADSLVADFPEDVSGKKLLFPRVETGGREVLVGELTRQGAIVEEVPAYESGCPKAIAPVAWEALKNRRVDAITFASSKTVKNFCKLIERQHNACFPDGEANSPWQSLLEGICIASIGPQTSITCNELLSKVDVEAKEYTLEGLLQSLIEFIER
ncbi:uroporphyrinogen-III C-methyltransferase [Phormidium sp. CCY1219]|uniref:uroporphyrinogen-III C-methyltransferase n=1 Tax=Phormidium sp. CCY1219 TaxID=2886104 RepID=UPI002D1F4A75|nr:uroporphyrinogen-III C-methyltransferase [Phormidium sp. CCY1219]MEB3826062.1 uroporphyrinogen-III C-methyltransferase [Phormidium sp. CCY1219]